MRLTKYRLLVLSPLVLLQGCGPETGFCLIKDGGDVARSVIVGRISNLSVTCYANAGDSVTEIPYEELTSGDGLPGDNALPRRLTPADDNLRIDLIESLSSDINLQVVGGEFQVAVPAWTTVTSFKFSFYGNFAKNPRALNQTRLNTPTITVKPQPEDAPRHSISLIGAPAETQIRHNSPHLTSQIPSGYFSGFTVGAGETIQIDVPTQGPTCRWSCDSGVYIVCGLEVSIEKDAICTYIPDSNPTLSQFSTRTTGSGRVIIAPNGPAQCPATDPCTLSTGTNIELLAEPDMGSSFVEWSEDCAAFGANPSATIVLDRNKTCTAIFTDSSVQMVDLDVQLDLPMGLEAKVVAIDGASIDCGLNCSAQVPSGQPVVLEVQRTSDNGPTLEVEWTGPGCNSNQASVTVTPTQNVTCRAEVSLPDPCATVTVPTIALTAYQDGIQLTESAPDQYDLVRRQGTVLLDATMSSSPTGALIYAWELDGTTGSGRDLNWTSPDRGNETTGTLTVTDTCMQQATLSFVFLAP